MRKQYAVGIYWEEGAFDCPVSYENEQEAEAMAKQYVAKFKADNPSGAVRVMVVGYQDFIF